MSPYVEAKIRTYNPAAFVSIPAGPELMATIGLILRIQKTLEEWNTPFLRT